MMPHRGDEPTAGRTTVEPVGAVEVDRLDPAVPLDLDEAAAEAAPHTLQTTQPQKKGRIEGDQRQRDHEAKQHAAARETIEQQQQRAAVDRGGDGRHGGNRRSPVPPEIAAALVVLFEHFQLRILKVGHRGFLSDEVDRLRVGLRFLLRHRSGPPLPS
jgi:hypothetical protein